ncbi:uncharacterized protein LOC124207171 [Daphnia pulex]|uniref:uncharacterized protein LOC124207171 n=1 Tax=Daphnia pulex TaxID=6669 RepID=UPI001EDE6F73|nr:uncharacterized protein LOC124207171 [Daphnia pulex]XP_046650816.1 uncharacterized protein LOC124341903 [Daphnia pulicaria]
MAQWPISTSQKEERMDFSSKLREKPVTFWLSKVYVNEHRYKFDCKGVISSYFGTQRTNIPCRVSVVGCISQPNEDGCNLIRKVQTRIDSQQYINFLLEVMASYPTVEPITVVHNKYPVYSSLKVTKWLGENPRMSVLDSWPPASGDLMPMDAVFSKILTEFDEQEMRVHSEKDLYEEIKNTFVSLTEKDGYVKSIISQIPIKLQKILLKKGESV